MAEPSCRAGATGPGSVVSRDCRSDAAATLDSIRRRLPTWHHDYFDRHRRRYERTLRVIEDVAGPGELLDIGAAPLHFTALLKGAGYRVVAVDLDPSRHAETAAAFALEVHRCDIEREPLPFAEGRFTGVAFLEIFEHLRVDPLFALAQVNRVLATGGTLVLTTPNLYAAQTLARFAMGRGINDGLTEFAKLRQLGHMGHIREYTRAELHGFLAASGFAVRRHRFADYSAPGGRRQTAKFLAAHILPRRLLSFHEIVAEKLAAAPPLRPI